MKNHRQIILAITAGLALGLATSGKAGSADVTASPSFSSINAATKDWWNGSSVLGNWFGLGYPLADAGLKIEGEAKEVYLGQVTGGLPGVQKSNWVNEVKLKGTYDFGKVFGLDGLTVVSNWRYRNVDGSQNNPTTGWAAGTLGNSSMFNPSKDTSGMGIRIMTQFLQWQTGDVKDPNFQIKGGWVNPYEDFLQQPDSKWFQNNAIATAKGIGGSVNSTIVGYSTNAAGVVLNTPVLASGTGVPWSSSYAAWGGSLRAKPSSSTYVQSGLYMAIGNYNGQQGAPYTVTDAYPYKANSSQYVGTQKWPVQLLAQVNGNGVLTGGYALQNNKMVYNNHGFNFGGAKTYSNPNISAANTAAAGYPATGQYYNNNLYSQNGLYNVNEIGWTPKIGADKLAGKYAIGAYEWGQNSSGWNGGSYVYGSKKAVATAAQNLIWGLYLQADQRLTAVHNTEAAPQPTGKNPVDTKNPVPATISTADKVRGLYMFNEVSFTPQNQTAIPLYFQTGFTYKGLFNARKLDTCGVALGAGFYSSALNNWQNTQNQALTANYNGVNATPQYTVPNANGVVGNTSYYAYAPRFSSTEVVEAFYNVQVNKWLTFRPDAQWIVNPAGNATVGNAFILGGEICAKF